MIKGPLSLEPVAFSLAVGVVLAWCLSAFALELPLLASQNSRLLMKIGAADGTILHTHEWWRIISSQFLHVHFQHMLFNAVCILMIGGFIEAGCGWRSTFSVYVIGGCIGQWASVLAYPDQVSSGASQALMALCGAAFVTVSRLYPRLLVFAITAVQVMLDIHVARTIKAGHAVGFLAGLLVGVVLLKTSRTRAGTSAIS
jgi:rhomboid protease GluP